MGSQSTFGPQITFRGSPPLVGRGEKRIQERAVCSDTPTLISLYIVSLLGTLRQSKTPARLLLSSSCNKLLLLLLFLSTKDQDRLEVHTHGFSGAPLS